MRLCVCFFRIHCVQSVINNPTQFSGHARTTAPAHNFSGPPRVRVQRFIIYRNKYYEVLGPGYEVLGLGYEVLGPGCEVLGTLSIIVSVMAPPPIFYLKLWGVGAYLEIVGGST